MNIIRVSTENEISVHEFPTGTWEYRQKVLCELIGNNCRMVEHVMPRKLYTELGHPNTPTRVKGQCVSMLVDEEGLLKTNTSNPIGCYLYETDKHGYPIMGNILLIGEYLENGSIEFGGIENTRYKVLYEQINNLIKKGDKL